MDLDKLPKPSRKVLQSIVAWAAVLAIAACQSSDVNQSDLDKGPEGSVLTNDPNVKLFEQLSSGGFQADAAVETLANAVILAESIRTASKSKESIEAADELLAILNQCGKDLAGILDPPNGVDEVKLDFAKFDDQRLKAIETANDCLHILDESNGILDLADSHFKGSLSASTQLKQKVTEAMDDIIGAIDAFGGTVEPAE